MPEHKRKFGGVDATISRVVPGRLVYVQKRASDETLALTPDKFCLQNADGSLRVYRGEPFQEIGIAVGNKVSVIDFDTDHPQMILEETAGKSWWPIGTLKIPSIR